MLNPTGLFASLPNTLRDELVTCYGQIVRNYAEHRWEPAELNGGKLCEIVHSVVKGALSGSFPGAASKPRNMVDACRALEQRPANATLVGDRSLRILIPRLLPFLYEIRNNRGVGHVGGEVNPNHADAEAVMSLASWIMAELVRVFHNVSLPDAQAAVDALVERRHPLVWEVDGVKRVLDPRMKKADQSLVLLYSCTGWTDVVELCGWVEYSSIAMFKVRVLQPLHENRLVEFQTNEERIHITPRGVAHTEDNLLRSSDP